MLLQKRYHFGLILAGLSNLLTKWTKEPGHRSLGPLESAAIEYGHFLGSLTSLTNLIKSSFSMREKEEYGLYLTAEIESRKCIFIHNYPAFFKVKVGTLIINRSMRF